MILFLTWRDPVLKVLIFVAGVAILVGLLSGPGPHPAAAIASAAAFALAASVALATHHADTKYLAPLPILVSDIYAARILVTLALIWGPILCAGYWLTETSALAFGAFATLALVVLQSVSIRAAHFPAVSYIVLLPLLTTVAARAIFRPEWLEGSAAIPPMAGCLAVSSLLFLWTWKTVPAAFAAPGHARLQPEPSLAAPAKTSRSGWRSMLILYTWQYVIWIGVIFVQTTTNGIIGAGFAAFTWQGAQAACGWVYCLPVARGKLLPLFLIPAILASLLGTAVHNQPGWWFYNSVSSKILMQHEGTCDNRKSARVPLEYWQRTPVAAPALVRAPWGETTASVPVRILGFEVYNPYYWACGNTPRFIDWQEGRAAAATMSHPLRARTAALYAVLQISLLISVVMTLLIYHWHPLQRLSPSVRSMPAFVAALVWIAGITAPIWHWFITPADAIVCLSWALPGPWLMCILPLPVLLYLATNKLFREGEFLDRKKTAAS